MHVALLTAADRAAWSPLWQGYLEFYQQDLPAEVTEGTFARLTDPQQPDMLGFLARADDGTGLGLVHCVFHPNTWSLKPLCYLEDLYVTDRARAQGVGRALIGAVEALARARDCRKVYWHTHQHNSTARALYDKVAPLSDFVRYDIAL
jgi:GNAT superfamily N-acetyltransferase